MHWQVFLPISFGNVGLISSEIIMLTTYLGSWALIALIITLRFLVNFRLFLLEAIRVGNSSSLLFQTHLRLVWKLLPMVATLCIPPFEQLVEKDVHQFLKNISKWLHNRSFSNILFDFSWDSHHASLSSCVGSKMRTWLSTHIIIIFFCLASNVFSFAKCTMLGLLHLLALGLSHYIFGQPLDPKGIHLLHCIHGGERIVFHDAHVGCLSIHCKRCRFSCCTWLDPHSSSTYPLILMSMGWHCAFILWHSHVGRCCHCWPHYTGLGFACYIVSWGGHDNGGSNKKMISSRSI